MKRTFYTIAFLFCIFFSQKKMIAQNIFDRLDFYDTAVSPIAGIDFASLCKTSDGNLASVIYVFHTNPKRYVLSFIKFTPQGKSVWHINFKDSLTSTNPPHPNPNHSYSSPVHITELKDSSFIFVTNAGATELNMPNGKDFIIKTDKKGNFQWMKYFAFDSLLSSANQTLINGIIATNDNGFILFGQYNTIYFYFSMKIDAAGNIVWLKKMNSSGFTLTGTIIPTYDGGYMLSGSYGGAAPVPALLKVDSLGNPVFLKYYSIITCSSCWVSHIMAEVPGNGFIFSGLTDYLGFKTPYLLRVDSTGTILWHKVYNVTGNTTDMDVYCVGANKSRELITIGRTIDASNTWHLFYFVTDNAGAVKWARTDQQIYALPHFIIPFGNDFIYGAENQAPGGIARLDSSFNGFCNYTSVSMSAVSPLAIQNSYTLSTAANPATHIIPWPFNFQFDTILADTILCPYIPVAVAEENNKDDFSIYPNPSTGSFTIAGNKEIREIEVYSVLGEKIYSSTVNSKLETVNLSAAPKVQASGIYFLRIGTSEGIISKKIIIAR